MSAVQSADELVVVPRPQQLSGSGTGPPTSTTPDEAEIPGLAPQGFEVDITPSTVTVRYSDDAGLRYARGFLSQVRAQSGEAWPQLAVRDWPDFAVRGYMLDVSRGRVPTRQCLDRIVEILELVRINQLQLYTEHTFAYSDHEVVWRDASPLTAEDIRWLDERCRDAGVELVANQNCFGHMEQWLRHDGYRHRAETPDGFQFLGQDWPATSLAPTADNAAFALGLLDELLPNFSSRQVNIGCDETWELGKGVSGAEVRDRGEGQVYLDHLRRLLEPLIDRRHQPQFWGDIIAHYPDLVGELPAGATAVAWTYEAPRTPSSGVAERFRKLGLDPDEAFGGFAARITPFVEAGYPYWVAPGTSSWRSLIGRLDNAIDNLIDAADLGKASGAEGYLITDWGDQGHLQPPSVSFPPLVFGAGVSWSLTANRDLALRPILDQFIFGDATGQLSSALEILGHAWQHTGRESYNCSPLQAALTDSINFVEGDPDPERVRKLIADLDATVTDISTSQPTASDGDVVKRELIAATRLAQHGAYRLLRDVGAQPLPDADMRADLERAIALHREAWLERSRPGGMEVGLDELEATMANYGPRP